MKLGKTTKRIIIAVFLIGLIGGAWGVWYVFFKPHRNVGTETAAYSLTAKDLSAQIAADTAALSKYIDKALELQGTVTAIEDKHIAFDNVICNMDSTELSKLSAIKPGQVLKVQGRFATYNDLLEEILIDQCVIK